MKTIFSVSSKTLCHLLLLSLFTACLGTHHLTITPSVSLNQGNFKYVRPVSAKEQSVYILGIGGMSSEQQTANAYNSLINEAWLRPNQAVANVSYRTSIRRYFPFGIFCTEVTTVASGWVVEFLPECSDGVVQAGNEGRIDSIVHSEIPLMEPQIPQESPSANSASHQIYLKKGKMSDWALIEAETRDNYTVVTLNLKLNQKGAFWIPNSVCLDWGSGKAAPVRIKIKNEVWKAERDVDLDEKISGKSGEQYQVTLFFEKLPEQVQQFNFVIPDFISWEGITVK